MPKSMLLRVLLSCCLLLLALSAIWAAINFTGSGVAAGEAAISRAAEITGIENPLDDNGDVDYVLAMNLPQMIGVKRDNNAIVTIVETCSPAMADLYSDRFFYLLSMERPDPESPKFIAAQEWIDENVIANQTDRGGSGQFAPTATQFADFGRDHLWNDDELPELARWLEAIEEPITSLAAAAKRERFYFPVVLSDDDKKPLAVKYDLILHIGKIAIAFKIKANYYLANGDFDGWNQQIDTIYQLARLVERGNSMVNQLVAIGIQELGDEAVASAVVNGKLDSGQLNAVFKKLNEMPTVNGMSRSIRDGERMLVLDLITKCARQGATTLAGDKKAGIYKTLLMKTADWNQVVEIINSDFERIAEIAELKDKEMLQAAVDFESEMEQRNKIYGHPATEAKAFLGGRSAKGKLVGNQFADMLAPGPIGLCSSVLRHKTQRKMTLIAIALEMHRQSNESYPDNLETLVPEFINRVDVDSFNDQPFEYRLQEDGYELYSLGANGTDEGGPKGSNSQDASDVELEYTRYQDWHDFLTAESTQ